jgi:hypothetical protein
MRTSPPLDGNPFARIEGRADSNEGRGFSSRHLLLLAVSPGFRDRNLLSLK